MGRSCLNLLQKPSAAQDYFTRALQRIDSVEGDDRMLLHRKYDAGECVM